MCARTVRPVRMKTNILTGLRLLMLLLRVASPAVYSRYIGDINADTADSGSLFANLLTHFCQDNIFILSSEMLLLTGSYT